MSALKDGGPAFPQSMNPEGPFGGMSLRDWFAGQALTGLIAHPDVETEFEAVVKYAFDYADAMLAERDRQP